MTRRYRHPSELSLYNIAHAAPPPTGQGPALHPARLAEGRPPRPVRGRQRQAGLPRGRHRPQGLQLPDVRPARPLDQQPPMGGRAVHHEGRQGPQRGQSRDPRPVQGRHPRHLQQQSARFPFLAFSLSSLHRHLLRLQSPETSWSSASSRPRPCVAILVRAVSHAS